jgi:hypothetical protein
MSILFGYDYFDTTTEDLNTLKQKLTTIEKQQQGNSAEIVANTNDIKKLNGLGKNVVIHLDFYKRLIFQKVIEIMQNS